MRRRGGGVVEGDGGAGNSAPAALSGGVLGAPSVFSIVLPRENGAVFWGMGARSRVALRRSRSDISAGRMGMIDRSIRGSM